MCKYLTNDKQSHNYTRGICFSNGLHLEFMPAIIERSQSSGQKIMIKFCPLPSAL